MTMMAPGMVAILNCAAGDTKISFDPAKPEDAERARDIVVDMLRRGYAVMVKEGDAWMRVEAFDPEKSEYLVGEKSRPRTRRAKFRRRVPAASARAVSVGPTAGGGCGCWVWPPRPTRA